MSNETLSALDEMAGNEEICRYRFGDAQRDRVYCKLEAVVTPEVAQILKPLCNWAGELYAGDVITLSLVLMNGDSELTGWIVNSEDKRVLKEFVQNAITVFEELDTLENREVIDEYGEYLGTTGIREAIKAAKSGEFSFKCVIELSDLICKDIADSLELSRYSDRFKDNVNIIWACSWWTTAPSEVQRLLIDLCENGIMPEVDSLQERFLVNNLYWLIRVLGGPIKACDYTLKEDTVTYLKKKGLYERSRFEVERTIKEEAAVTHELADIVQDLFSPDDNLEVKKRMDAIPAQIAKVLICKGGREVPQELLKWLYSKW